MESDWREGLGSVVEQQLYMLEHGTLSDCTFTLAPDVGETREFRLHRLVLARCSEVFEAMLLPPGERMQEALTGRVTITDIQPEIFHIALKFMYSLDSSELSGLPVDAVLRVSGVADKYRILQLRTACEHRLCELLDPSCVWRLLGLSGTLQGYGELQDKCVQLLRLDTPACLRSPDVYHATEESMVLLLRQDSLALDSEMPLVLAAVSWARMEAYHRADSVRDTLEPRVLPLLRLLSLSAEQLELLSCLADWISDSEREALRARNPTGLPECFSRTLEKRAVTPCVPATPPPSEKLYSLDRRSRTTTEVIRGQKWSSKILIEVSSPVWLKGIFFYDIEYLKIDNTSTNHFHVRNYDITISSCTIDSDNNTRLSHTVFHRFKEAKGILDNRFLMQEPYWFNQGQTYCIEIHAKPRSLGEVHFSKNSLKHTAMSRDSDVLFTFNRRGTRFESLIKGPDILHGLVYSV